MGISGLLPFLKNASRPVNVKELKGSTAAIDVYCFLHKGAFGCAELLMQVVPAESEKLESQVIWLDPDEQRNRAAITLKLSMETPDLGSINFSENMTAAFDMETTMETKKVFTITSGIDEMKAKDKIESLGGILDTNISLDNLPTHVIAVKVSRSEKMLLCIASGRWILHSSYLEDSVKAGKWLQESDYELGNPENQIIDLTADTPESKMCIAARKHRIAAEKGSKAVFSDLITYLALPSQKQLAFLRLIKAGGGTVVEELTTQTMKTLTHVITENKHFKMVESKAKQLSEYSIPLIIPLYLNDFLNNESIPLVENYLVEEYKPLWENMKGRQTSTRYK